MNLNKNKILFFGSIFVIAFLVFNFVEIKIHNYNYAFLDKQKIQLNFSKLFALAAPINTLIVQSLPIQSIPIGGSFGGTTNYTINSGSLINDWLKPPATYTVASTTYEFKCWKGCSEVNIDTKECHVYVNDGLTQLAQAEYATSAVVVPPPPPANFDVAVTNLDIRTFICNNNDYDSSQSFWNSVSSTYPSYAPSTTWAYAYYTEIVNPPFASSSCPETQSNRPVGIKATVNCIKDDCKDAAIAEISITAEPDHPSAYNIPTPYDFSINEKYEGYMVDKVINNYPTNFSAIFFFKYAYNFKIKACITLRDKTRPEIRVYDENTANDCMSTNLRVFNYICSLGFPKQTQTNWSFSPPIKVTKNLNTNSALKYWFNSDCAAQHGFNNNLLFNRSFSWLFSK
jgi:hypothetical protein